MTHYKIYMNNINRIDNHNKENHTWKMGINNFTDISFSEFKSIYLQSRPMNHSRPRKLYIPHKATKRFLY